MIPLILFLAYLGLCQSKNLLFPFKKLTIEYLNETKTISDFVRYNVYTNIIMGTPKKPVAHFIARSNILFYYNLLFIHSHSGEAYKQIQNKIENSLNIYYTPDNSTSFEIINKSYQIYSDIYYLYDLNNNEKQTKLHYNMNYHDTDKKIYGNINLWLRGEPSDKYNKYIFKMLKERELIDETYYTFIYGDYNIKFGSNYLSDDYNSIIGNLILGETPHEFYPNKYKKEDEIKINGQLEFSVSQVSFKTKKSTFLEENIRLTITYTSQFIRGSIGYKNETDKIFFNDLISKNICRVDIVEENIYVSKDYIYSCENSNFMKEKIKTFPTLYFVIKPYNLTFFFTYEELFQLHNNRIYFLVYYTVITSYSKWEVGELFLRKYITSFNYYSKTTSFYRNQVDEINNKTYKVISNEEPYVKPEQDPKVVIPEGKMEKWKIGVIVGAAGLVVVAAIIVIAVLVLKLKKYRKKRAAELIDDNYEYATHDNIIN